MEQNQNNPAIVNQQPPMVAASVPQIKYAGFWIRWVANFVDGLVLIIPNLIVGLIIKFAILGVAQQILGTISSLLISWVYFILMTNKYQATLGKKVFGLMVVSNKEGNLTLEQIIIRETIGKIASMIILFIGYIMAGFTERKQALHDMIAKTVVVYKDPNKKFTGGSIALIVIACILPFIAIMGILASIVLASLSNARGKAQDASIKATLASYIPEAIIYENDNFSYKGYKPQALSNELKCSGQPIVNVSDDGKQMAIFIKSCQEDNRYFCANPTTSLVTGTAEVDEIYVKAGATTCNATDIPEISLNIKDASTDIPTDYSGSASENQSSDGFFTDTKDKYEIKYPVGWASEGTTDEQTGAVTTAYYPESTYPPITVYVQYVSGQQPITPEALNVFTMSIKRDVITNKKGNAYDEKDFIYTFADGSKSTGKAFKAEYIHENKNFKQWLIAIPSGNTIHQFIYVSETDQYDANYNTAISMLDSWKISK